MSVRNKRRLTAVVLGVFICFSSFAQASDEAYMINVLCKKDNAWEQVKFNMTYPESCESLNEICGKFFFGNTSAKSVKEQGRQFFEDYTSIKTYSSDKKVSGRYIMNMKLVDETPKYRCYLLEKRVIKMGRRTYETFNLVYDVAKNRILTVDNVLIPELAQKIKRIYGNRDFSIIMNEEMIVFGSGDKVLESYFYGAHPDIFTEDFFRLIDMEKEVAAFEKKRADYEKAKSEYRRNHAATSQQKEYVSGRVVKDEATGMVSQVVADEIRGDENTKVFTVVEQMPSFPGGDAALMAYLSQNVQYPPIAEEMGIQGRVLVSFVVERDGSITNVHVERGVDPSLDREAIRVVKAMPRWNPGKQNNSPVRVMYTTPVTFRLQ